MFVLSLLLVYLTAVIDILLEQQKHQHFLLHAGCIFTRGGQSVKKLHCSAVKSKTNKTQDIVQFHNKLYCPKWHEHIKTLNFTRNVIFMRHSKHLFLHYILQMLFIWAHIGQQIRQYWFICDWPISADNIRQGSTPEGNIRLLCYHVHQLDANVVCQLSGAGPVALLLVVPVHPKATTPTDTRLMMYACLVVNLASHTSNTLTKTSGPRAKM